MPEGEPCPYCAHLAPNPDELRAHLEHFHPEVEPEPLAGVVEADETYHGNAGVRFGRRIPGRGGISETRTAVLGAIRLPEGAVHERSDGRRRLRLSDSRPVKRSH